MPVKLRISLPSAWKVMRATLVASVATALMVSVCTYFSLVPGALIGQRRRVEVAARPAELVALRGDGAEGVPRGLVRAVGALQPVVVELVRCSRWCP